jgi:hypothetical protein
MYGTMSGSFLMAGFGISGIKLSATTVFVFNCAISCASSVIDIQLYYESHLHLLGFRHSLLLADSPLVAETLKQEKADKLSHCDLMIE